MTVAASSILPDNLRGRIEVIPIDAIEIPDERFRDADLSVVSLVDSIERQGLQQPIGVKEVRSLGLCYRLIWGRRRVEAHRVYTDRLGDRIEAKIFPEELPDEWANILELEENEQRQDLTADERARHTMRVAALIKMLEDRDESLAKSEISQPTTRRGHKGIVQKVAEAQRVDQASVRKRVDKVAERIGEPVDLQKDDPQELLRKADQFERTPKAEKRRQQDRENRARRQDNQFKHESDPLWLLAHLESVMAWEMDRAASWVAELEMHSLNYLVHRVPPLQTKLGELIHVVKAERKRRADKRDERNFESFDDAIEAATGAQEDLEDILATQEPDAAETAPMEDLDEPAKPKRAPIVCAAEGCTNERPKQRGRPPIGWRCAKHA
jgi:ParB-like chromosome segregation protein Spo0J